MGGRRERVRGVGWAVCEVWADRWVEGEGKTKGFIKTKSLKP